MAVAPNATVSPVVDYGPEPRGWRWFRGLAAMGQRAIAGREGTAVVEHVAMSHGPVRVAPQVFTGAAGLGRAVPVAQTSSELSAERAAGVLSNPYMRVFADRLRG